MYFILIIRKPPGYTRTDTLCAYTTLIRSCAVRRQLHARRLNAAGDRIGAQALAAVAAVRGKTLGALLHDVAHPEHGLDVLVQRRPPEQADLGDVGRAVARQAALALVGFQHRGLFAADVGPRAAAPLPRAVVREARGLQLGDLLQQEIGR